MDRSRTTHPLEGRRRRDSGMRQGLLRVAAWVTVLILVAGIQALALESGGPTEREVRLSFGGRLRSCIVHLPPGYTGTKPLPLVLVLHGGAGNARRIEAKTGMSPKADHEGFIVAYPNGTGRIEGLFTWNAGNCCGYALHEHVDDVGFVRALVGRLEKQFAVDPRRVYVTGISNGGMMAYRLACELPEKIAGIAPVAGAMNVECRPASPVSLVAFHGTADLHVLYEGGRPKRTVDYHARSDTSVADAVSFWVKRDGCGPAPERQKKGSVTTEVYADCTANTGVALYSIEGGGHVWPGGKKGFLEIGEPAHEISATDIIWEFFNNHPKP